MTLRIPTPPGTPVRVYRNLTLKSWSVQAKVKTGRGRQHAWKVVGHADRVALKGVTFKVYERGRQRVLLTGVKNVHAFVLGELIAVDQLADEQEAVWRVAYNPHYLPYFHLPSDHDAPVSGAADALLDPTGRVYATSTWHR